MTWVGFFAAGVIEVIIFMVLEHILTGQAEQYYEKLKAEEATAQAKFQAQVRQRDMENTIDPYVLERIAGDFGLAGGVDRPMQVVGGAGTYQAFSAGFRESPVTSLPGTAGTSGVSMAATYPTIITSSTKGSQQAGMFSGATSLWKRFFGGGKDKETSKSGTVAPKAVYEYLLSKGVDRIHALGILANIEAESSFRIGVVNSIGAVGLFQYLGSRKYGNPKGPGTVHPGFLALVPDWQTNWKAQIDYALSVEPESESRMKKYLSMPFATAADAAEAFCLMFERPERKESKGRYRRGLVVKWIRTFAKPKTSRSGARIKRGYNPASSTTIDRGPGHYETIPQGPRKPSIRVWVPDNTQAYVDPSVMGGEPIVAATNVVESSIGPSIATTVINNWDPRGETFTPQDSSGIADYFTTNRALA